MTPRALIVDAAGRILRTLTAPPSMMASNVRDGEILFLVYDDDGLAINDGLLVVSEAGEIVAAEGSPEGLTVPGYDLQYIPA